MKSMRDLISLVESYTPRSSINIVDVDSYYYGQVPPEKITSNELAILRGQLNAIFDGAILKAHAYFKTDGVTMVPTGEPFRMNFANISFSLKSGVLAADVEPLDDRKMNVLIDMLDGLGIKYQGDASGFQLVVGEVSEVEETRATLRKFVSAARDAAFK